MLLVDAYSRAILFTWGNGSSPQRQGGTPTKPRGSVMDTKGVRSRHEGVRFWATRGAVPGMQGNGSTTKPNGIMKVAILDFDLA